jgi:isopentenyl-diphosphate delta-isomerase
MEIGVQMPAPDDHNLIDIVDDNDHVIGALERATALETKANFRVAHIFVFNSSGELLLQQLGRVRTRDPGRWGSSVAAHLHAGESYEAAAQRRIGEELRVVAKVSFVDKVRMNDRGSVKFVGLFEARSDRAENAEPDHMGGLEFRPIEWVVEKIATEPDVFTETFRILFARYLELRSAASA